MIGRHAWPQAQRQGWEAERSHHHGSRHGGRAGKLRDHIFRRRLSTLELGQGYKLSKPLPISSSKTTHIFITTSNCPIDWGLSVQMCDHMREVHFSFKWSQSQSITPKQMIINYKGKKGIVILADGGNRQIQFTDIFFQTFDKGSHQRPCNGKLGMSIEPRLHEKHSRKKGRISRFRIVSGKPRRLW